MIPYEPIRPTTPPPLRFAVARYVDWRRRATCPNTKSPGDWKNLLGGYSRLDFMGPRLSTAAYEPRRFFCRPGTGWKLCVSTYLAITYDRWRNDKKKNPAKPKLHREFPEKGNRSNHRSLRGGSEAPFKVASHQPNRTRFGGCLKGEKLKSPRKSPDFPKWGHWRRRFHKSPAILEPGLVLPSFFFWQSLARSERKSNNFCASMRQSAMTGLQWCLLTPASVCEHRRTSANRRCVCACVFIYLFVFLFIFSFYYLFI